MLARHIFRTNFLNMFFKFSSSGNLHDLCRRILSDAVAQVRTFFVIYAVFIGISEISYMQCPLGYHHKYNVFFHRDINRPIVRFDLGSQVLTDFLSQQFSYSKDCLDFGFRKKCILCKNMRKRSPKPKKHDTVTIR